ncbi:MAG: hypothetical protein IKT50_05980, partial [Clostridia bacterium]|nr:hypothetical protein [Clostridia bacterium]
LEMPLNALRDRVEFLAGSRSLSGMMNLVDDRRMILATLDREMENAMTNILQEKKSGLLQKAAALDALSPLAVLTRGYSAVFNEKGETVSQKKNLSVGDKVTLRLSDGTAKAEILEVEQ